MPDKRYSNRPDLIEIRRDLRHHATPAERALWQGLKGRSLVGLKFRRQHSIGRYVLDFYCPEMRLAVELDGAVHFDPSRRDYDILRERELAAMGIIVIRFENREVLTDLDLVLAQIEEAIGV